MKTLFWELLARLGFWIPCNKYMPNPKYWDWVLISLKDNASIDRCMPHIAEYSESTHKWYDLSGDANINDWINELVTVTHWRKIPNDRNLK